MVLDVEYSPEAAPLVVGLVVDAVHALLTPVRGSGWQTSTPRDQDVRRQLRLILRRFELPPTGELFDRAHAYIRENY